jgi:hexosaminidase
VGQQASSRPHTDIGALHGLETLLQLLRSDNTGATLPVVSIRDRPRFPWRGLMIDVARRWQPMEVIQRNLDAMAVVKLNVLHLHLTEDQGFRIESLTHPELQGLGSDGKYFTQAQMRTRHRLCGGPRHPGRAGVRHPGTRHQLGRLPPRDREPAGSLRHRAPVGRLQPRPRPTNEATYALLADFLGEMAGPLPRPVHAHRRRREQRRAVEREPGSRPTSRTTGLAGNAGLHAMFNQRIDGSSRRTASASSAGTRS